MTQPLHATAVVRHGPGGWRGVLLRGTPGSGKSDMALRLIDAGWRLVADDYAHVFASDGRLFACTPDRIAGRIEARGLGIVPLPYHPVARIILLVDCAQTPAERLPDADFETVAGISLPRLTLDVRPASAVVTLGLAIERL
jgi:serine kinase of HPr protein (carbohydrate metabolism regulator)